MSDYVIDQERPWLGGYLPGGDAATIYPELWSWLVTDWNVRSVLDVGCGEGFALQYFRDEGCEVLGVDGIKQPDSAIVEHDYTTGEWEPVDEDGTPSSSGGPRYDLAWCCEFVEHIEEQYVSNFMLTFKCAAMVLMTHGTPGQPGHHHVNNQPASYWKGALAATGFQYDHFLTMAARQQAALNPHPSNHFVRSGLAFRR